MKENRPKLVESKAGVKRKLNEVSDFKSEGKLLPKRWKRNGVVNIKNAKDRIFIKYTCLSDWQKVTSKKNNNYRPLCAKLLAECQT